jgi:hypothetical protein
LIEQTLGGENHTRSEGLRQLIYGSNRAREIGDTFRAYGKLATSSEPEILFVIRINKKIMTGLGELERSGYDLPEQIENISGTCDFRINWPSVLVTLETLHCSNKGGFLTIISRDTNLNPSAMKENGPVLMIAKGLQHLLRQANTSLD